MASAVEPWGSLQVAEVMPAEVGWGIQGWIGRQGTQRQRHRGSGCRLTSGVSYPQHRGSRPQRAGDRAQGKAALLPMVWDPWDLRQMDRQMRAGQAHGEREPESHRACRAKRDRVGRGTERRVGRARRWGTPEHSQPPDCAGPTPAHELPLLSRCPRAPRSHSSLPVTGVYLLFVETGSGGVAQVAFELEAIPLPQPPEC